MQALSLNKMKRKLNANTRDTAERFAITSWLGLARECKVIQSDLCGETEKTRWLFRKKLTHETKAF